MASSVRSAAAYQRVEQFSRLGGEITGLVQALQTEREDTIRYITMGPAAGGRGAPARRGRARAGRARPGPPRHRPARGPVRSLAATSAAPTRRWHSRRPRARSPRSTGSGALRSAATGTQIPSLSRDPGVRRHDRPVARPGGRNRHAAATTRRWPTPSGSSGLISGMKEEVSQEQAILTSALTPDLVGAGQFQPGQLSALNAAQAEQQADLAQFGLSATAQPAPALQQHAVLGAGRPGAGTGPAGDHPGARRRILGGEPRLHQRRQRLCVPGVQPALGRAATS